MGLAIDDALVARIPWGNPRVRAARAVHGLPLSTASKLGRLLVATRRSRIYVGGLLALSIVFAGTGLFAVARGILPGVSLLGQCGYASLFLGMAAFVFLVTRRRARDFVAVYDGGMAFDIGGRFAIMEWEHVIACHSQIADLVNGMTRAAHDTYAVDFVDGTRISWNWEFESHRDVGTRCREALETWQARATG